MPRLGYLMVKQQGIGSIGASNGSWRCSNKRANFIPVELEVLEARILASALPNS